MNDSNTIFHNQNIYDLASKYECFVRSACKFEYTNEHGMSLAVMKNLLDIEAGLTMSFLGNHQSNLEQIRMFITRALHQIKIRTRDETNLNMIEQLECTTSEAYNGTHFRSILDKAFDLIKLENDSFC